MGGKEPKAGAVDRTAWQDTIAAADKSLEAASQIQRSVQQNLDLMAEARRLKEELRVARVDLERYRALHTDAVASMQHQEARASGDLGRLKVEQDRLLLQHRADKLLSEYFALSAMNLDEATYLKHRDCVAQHLIYQLKKGVDISAIEAKDIAPLLSLGNLLPPLIRRPV